MLRAVTIAGIFGGLVGCSLGVPYGAVAVGVLFLALALVTVGDAIREHGR